MSTNACQKPTDSNKSGKKSAKRHHAIKNKKHSKWRNKQRSKNRGHQLEARRYGGPRQHSKYQSSLQPISSAMSSESRDPAASFWGNYKVAMEWQSKHFVNYWKSRCSALELENQHLYKTIEALSGAEITDQDIMNANEKDKFLGDILEEQADDQFRNDIKQEEQDSDDDEIAEEEINEDCQDEESFTFVIDEEMIQFLETSAKHKLDLKKKKDAEELEASEELVKATEKLKLPREIMAERRQEMSKLYGSDDAPMILGMETAMQLTFDRFVGKHQPKHWPNIPLNL